MQTQLSNTPSISMMDLRKEPGTILDKVDYRNESFVIERAGKPKAVLISVPEFEQFQQNKLLSQPVISTPVDQIQTQNASQPTSSQATVPTSWKTISSHSISLERLLKEHQQMIINTVHENDISYLAAFGSYTRGEQNEDSDLDMLVDFDKKKGLLGLVKAEEELSQVLGVQVDLVTRKGLSKYVKPYIQDDLQLIYAKES